MVMKSLIVISSHRRKVRIVRMIRQTGTRSITMITVDTADVESHLVAAEVAGNYWYSHVRRLAK